MLIFATVLSY